LREELRLRWISYISKEEKTSNPTILFLFQYFDQNRSQKLGTL
jgi:hypothetical protein